MNLLDYEDRLELIGVLGGLFIVVVGLGSLLNPPFTTNADTMAAIIQTVGILATIGVGVVMILVVYTGERTASLPFGT